MEKKPNAKLFMILTAAVAVIGGAAVYWQSGVAGEAARRVTKLESEARDQNQLQLELTASETQLTEVGGKLAHLERSVPEMAYVPTLLKELEATGKQYGMQILGVRPAPAPAATKNDKKKGKGESVAPKSYNELDIEVRARGTYKDVNRFSEALQTFPKILAVRSLTLMPRSERGGNTDVTNTPSLETTFVIRAYLFAPDMKAAEEEQEEEKTIDLSSRKKNTEMSTYEGR